MYQETTEWVKEDYAKTHWTYCPMCGFPVGEEEKMEYSFDDVPICGKCAQAFMRQGEDQPDEKKDVA